MSCYDCEKFQNEFRSYPYRWGTAVIELSACEKHAKQIIEVLNDTQNNRRFCFSKYTKVDGSLCDGYKQRAACIEACVDKEKYKE